MSAVYPFALVICPEGFPNVCDHKEPQGSEPCQFRDVAFPDQSRICRNLDLIAAVLEDLSSMIFEWECNCIPHIDRQTGEFSHTC